MSNLISNACFLTKWNHYDTTTNADAPFNKAQGNCVEEFTSKLNQHELHSNCEDDDGDKYPIRKKATENVDL
jgi:hypothetical protein